MTDVFTWFSNNSAYIFPAVYGLARLVSHLTPSYTIAGKVCSWVLGHVPQSNPPAP